MLESSVLINNFTLQDAFGSVVCVVVFAICLGVPGYVLAYAFDLFGFRRMGRAHQSAWAIALSFAISPISCYLISKFAGFATTCLVLLVMLPFFGWLAWRRSSDVAGGWAELRSPAYLGALWTAFVLLCLLDVQVGHKLYFSIVEFDQSYRVAFTQSVLHTGVPPANPLYFPGQAQPMRYYYFWYVLCAVVAHIAHASARQAFLASSVWAGLGLAAIIALFVRHFLGIVHGTRRQTAIFVALLGVTGLDLLPTLGLLLSGRVIKADMEWWAIDQVASWQDSVLWVPHHVASLLACLSSFLLLWMTRAEVRWRVRLPVLLVAAAGMASAFGLSIYVAAGCGLLLAAWCVRTFWDKDNAPSLLANVLFTGFLSVVLLWPFLHELLASMPQASMGTQASGTHIFSIGVRQILDPALLTESPLFRGLRATHPLLLDSVARLVLLVPGLVLELGIYGVVLLLLLATPRGDASRSTPQGQARSLAVFLSLCGLVMVSFVRSAVISSNDFGYRAALLPQFFLLLLTGEVLSTWWDSSRAPYVDALPRRKRMVYALLVLGAAGTIYQAAMLRLYLPLHEGQAQGGFQQLPTEAYEMRTVFTELDHRSRPDAVLEFDPTDMEHEADGTVVPENPLYARSLILYAGRQILSAEPGCGAAFGGDPRPCAAIEEATRQLYTSPATSATWAEAYCQRFHVEYLVIGARDAAWRMGGGWISGLPVVAAQPAFRVVQCASP